MRMSPTIPYLMYARLYFLAFVLTGKHGSALPFTSSERAIGRKLEIHYTKMAFQSHQFRAAIKSSVYRSHTLQYEESHDSSSSDPFEPMTNKSLRHSIQNLVSIIDSTNNTLSDHSSMPLHRNSIVHIVGTGVSPTLLNLPLSTLFILTSADVVLHDSLGLSHDDIRRIVPKDCEIICVGKRGDQKNSWNQGDINQLLLEKATESNLLLSGGDRIETPIKTTNIVRLKGGDPFLFGRTRTEIDALRANNIPYTYTPGISSCIAGPHLGGIPLTDASLDCQSFGVWSGTDAMGKSLGVKDDDDADRRSRFWQGMDVDVLVFLMIGRLDKLEALCNAIAHNCNETYKSGRWSNDTACAVIQNAGGQKEATGDLPVQRVWRSTLGNIVADIRKEDTNRTSVSPAVFVVGATATLDLLSQ